MDKSLICNSSTADPNRDWCIKTLELNHMVMCYKQTFMRNNGLWRAENAGSYLLPTFLLQLILILTINRLLMAVFRRFCLPRIAAEILGGVILGAGGVASTLFGKEYVYPYKSIMTLETVANLGLLFYMFLVGLEVDIKPIIQAPKKSFSIAVAGFIIPFPVGYALHYLMVKNFESVTKGFPTRHGPLFWGIALSTTNFPDLAQILSDLKLLRSEVGRTALSAAVITDFFSWILLVVSMAIVNNGHINTIMFSASFVVFCLLALRPALAWAIHRTSYVVEASGGYTDYHLSLVLTLVIACGYITDMCGCHSILGGFMLGLIMPKGELKEKLMEKIEDFVSGLMMPLFFVIIGLRTNYTFVFGKFSIGTILKVLIFAFVAKIGSTFLAAIFVNKMKIRDSLALGLLMNTKGLLALIVISSARDLKVLNNQTFTIIIMAIWLMTAAVGPILSMTYMSARPGGSDSRRRTISSLEPYSDFRILTCFHSSRDITGIVNLLDASNPTRNSPVSISAVHLVENLGRASAMLIVHDTCKTADSGGGGAATSDDRSGNPDAAAAAAFESLRSGKDPASIAVETLTAVSAYATMHVDVCSLAQEKRAALVLLPFHLDPAAVDSGGGAGESAGAGDPLRALNKAVMDNAECSVAVLVDRGHRLTTVLAKTDSAAAAGVSRRRHFLMIFVGGPDDREALAYVGRMSGSPGVSVTVVRFLAGGGSHVEMEAPEEGEEREIDDRSAEEFERRTRGNAAVSLTEVEVRSGDEIVKTINTMENGGEYDLIVVGKGRRGREARLATGTAEWSEFPELGSLGDSLVCSNFAANAWILVVQQGGGLPEKQSPRSIRDGGGRIGEQYGRMTWQAREQDRPDLAPFVCRGNKGC